MLLSHVQKYLMVVQHFICTRFKLPIPCYPQWLIPKKEYPILSSNEIDELDYLSKWVGRNLRLKDSDGKLNPAAIDIHDLPHFSTNKIPGSKLIDLYINFHKPFADYYRRLWAEGDPGIIPPNNHFFFDLRRQYYFIQVGQINGFAQPYPKVIKGNVTKELKFTLGVIHMPLISNYWHFEFELSDENGKIERLENKGWK